MHLTFVSTSLFYGKVTVFYVRLPPATGSSFSRLWSRGTSLCPSLVVLYISYIETNDNLAPLLFVARRPSPRCYPPPHLHRGRDRLREALVRFQFRSDVQVLVRPDHGARVRGLSLGERDAAWVESGVMTASAAVIDARAVRWRRRGRRRRRARGIRRPVGSTTEGDGSGILPHSPGTAPQRFDAAVRQRHDRLPPSRELLGSVGRVLVLREPRVRDEVVLRPDGGIARP